jgi:hypothetical protein
VTYRHAYISTNVRGDNIVLQFGTALTSGRRDQRAMRVSMVSGLK